MAPVISFATAVLVLPVLIKLLTKWQIFDETAVHKIHKSFTPSMGGIAIYAGMMVALLIILPLKDWFALKYFFIATSIMFFVGLRDDVLTLSPIEKLVGQLLPLVILVLFGELILPLSVFSLQGNQWPYWAIVSLTIFSIVLITNSYNLIDGLDGLAGSIGILVLTFFGGWFYLIGDPELSVIAFSIAGALCAFIIFNWQPSRIFMGDTGALLVGLILSYYCIQFMAANQTLEAGHYARFKGTLATLVAVMIVPFFDTFRVVIIRLAKGVSPLKGDKNHIHHQLLRLGLNHSQSVLVLLTLNLGFILLAILLRSQPDWLVLSIIAGLCLLLNFVLNRIQKNAKGNLVSV